MYWQASLMWPDYWQASLMWPEDLEIVDKVAESYLLQFDWSDWTAWRIALSFFRCKFSWNSTKVYPDAEWVSPLCKSSHMKPLAVVQSASRLSRDPFMHHVDHSPLSGVGLSGGKMWLLGYCTQLINLVQFRLLVVPVLSYRHLHNSPTHVMFVFRVPKL